MADPVMCAPFGNTLYQRAWESARLRQGLEERWYYDTIQYHGQYDGETQKRLTQNEGASGLFVNMTRPKTRVLRARLIDILLPDEDSNFDISPTPVPRVDRALARIKDSGKLPLQTNETHQAQEVMKVAKEAAANMKRLVDDQLTECAYTDVARMAITQACRLGTSVIKGPFAASKTRQTWQKKGGKDSWSIGNIKDMQPRFEFVDLWRFYPDMDASGIEDCEFTFQLHPMSRTELRRLANRGMFDKEVTKSLLEAGADYAPDTPGHFNTLLQYVRQLENELDETTQKRYLVFEYNGPIEYEEFGALCEYFEKPDLLQAQKDDPLEEINGTVWFCADQVLRFSLNPLESGRLPYSVFRLDPTENSLIGSVGVPRMLRDPQASLNAAWRMAMDSGGLEGIPMFVIDQTRIEPEGAKPWKIAPGKIWRAKGGFSPTEGGPPIQAISITGNLDALINLATISRGFMDDEANLPLIAQGEQGAGAKQTAHGMTLLANAVNVLFRDAARGFDADITVPNMTRLYEWNMQFSEDEGVKGDMEIKARGSSVLLVNEIVSQNMLMLMNLVVGNPDAFSMLKFETMLKLWFKTLRLDRYGLIKTEEEMEEIRKKAEEQPPPVDPMVEAKREIATMEIEARREELAMQREIAMLKLASGEQVTMAQIEASLDKVRMQGRTKERAFMAEAALKTEHGTGI